MTTETGHKLSSDLFTISHSTVESMYPDILNDEITSNSLHRPLRRIATFTSFSSNSVTNDPPVKTTVERTKSARITNNRTSSTTESKRTSSIHMSLTRVPSGATQNAAFGSTRRKKCQTKIPAFVAPAKIISETVNEDSGEWSSIDITSIDATIVSPCKRESQQSSESMTPRQLTKKDYLTIISLCLGHFSLGTVYALMAPFFPSESEKKGVSATFYGIVFSIFELGQFLFSPLIGSLIPNVGTKFALVIGMFICGWCTTIFGLLQWSPPRWTFFGLSFILRFVSSIGASAYFCSSFTLIATSFADRISTLFSLTEVFFGVGMIVGPSVGGVLFEHGGFSLPFFVTGGEFFLVCIFAIFAMKSEPQVTNTNDVDDNTGKKATVLNLCKEMGILVNMSITLAAFIMIGFNDTTLEHHVSQEIGLTPSQIGLLFLVGGGIYAMSTQLWGFLIQKFNRAHVFVVFGFIFSSLSLLLCGPAWPLPVKPSLMFVIIGQSFYGVSMGPQLVGSFTEGLSETLEAGYPDDLTTSATMSSLYQSTCALG